MQTLPRRVFLGGIASITTVLAGCNQTGEDGTDEGESTPESTPVTTESPTEAAATETATSEQTEGEDATEHLDAAFNAGEEASSLLLEELGKVDQTLDFVDFETDRITTLIEQGEEELAAAAPTGDQTEVAASLESIFAWLRPLTDGVAAYDDAVDAWETGDTYSSNDRFRDAAEQMETAQDRFSTAEEHTGEAEDAFDAITVEPLDGVDEADLTQAETPMQQFADAVAATTVYTRGLAVFMTATDAFLEGIRAYSEGRYSEVVEPLESARSESADANAAAQDAEEITPDWLLDRVLNLQCWSDAYRDAAAHFIAAVEARQAGDTATAEEEEEAANQAINRCESAD